MHNCAAGGELLSAPKVCSRCEWLDSEMAKIHCAMSIQQKLFCYFGEEMFGKRLVFSSRSCAVGWPAAAVGQIRPNKNEPNWAIFRMFGLRISRQ